MALPLPPTPLDAEQPYLTRFRKVRRDRSKLRDRYRIELERLERNGRIRPVRGVDEYDLGLFGRFVRWEHLRTTNRIRSKGRPRTGIRELEVPPSETDDLQRAVRQVIWTVHLTNAVNVTVQLLGVAAVVGLVLLVLGHT